MISYKYRVEQYVVSEKPWYVVKRFSKTAKPVIVYGHWTKFMADTICWLLNKWG